MPARAGEFKKIFKDIAPYENRYTVFRDFIVMASTAIQNSVLRNQKLEDKYMQICRGYTKQDMLGFSHLLGVVQARMVEDHSDFLGPMFMELELGSAHTGQFFTPPSVAEMMAQMNFLDLQEKLANQKYVVVSDPACGSGVMLLAAVNQFIKNESPYHTNLFIEAQDLDEVAAGMCYVQLDAVGAAAEVRTGNTLSGEVWQAMRTRAYYAFNWTYRLQQPKVVEKPYKPSIRYVRRRRP